MIRSARIRAEHDVRHRDVAEHHLAHRPSDRRSRCAANRRTRARFRSRNSRAPVRRVEHDAPTRRDLAVVGLKRVRRRRLDAVRIDATDLHAKRGESELVDAKPLEPRARPACAASGRTRHAHDATSDESATIERSWSVRARNSGSGEVRAENRAEVLPSARAADGAPLAHADAMPVAESSNRQPRESSIGRADDLGRKIRTVEKLATRRAEHITNVVAANAIPPARRLDPRAPPHAPTESWPSTVNAADVADRSRLAPARMLRRYRSTIAVNESPRQLRSQRNRGAMSQ